MKVDLNFITFTSKYHVMFCLYRNFLLKSFRTFCNCGWGALVRKGCSNIYVLSSQYSRESQRQLTLDQPSWPGFHPRQTENSFSEVDKKYVKMNWSDVLIIADNRTLSFSDPDFYYTSLACLFYGSKKGKKVWKSGEESRHLHGYRAPLPQNPGRVTRPGRSSPGRPL